MHRSLRGQGRATAVLVASAALVGTSVACVVAAAEADSSAVTVQVVDPDARPRPTRAEIVGALQVKLAADGRQLPPGWQDWPTQELRARLRTETYRDIDPEDLDPGMDFNPCGAWTKWFKPGCW